MAQSPLGPTSAAELNICEPWRLPLAGAVPIAPVTTHAFVLRAISLIAWRNSGSLVKNGAGDSGHTMRLVLKSPPVAALALPAVGERSLRPLNSFSVLSNN